MRCHFVQDACQRCFPIRLETGDGGDIGEIVGFEDNELRPAFLLLKTQSHQSELRPLPQQVSQIVPATLPFACEVDVLLSVAHLEFLSVLFLRHIEIVVIPAVYHTSQVRLVIFLPSVASSPFRQSVHQRVGNLRVPSPAHQDSSRFDVVGQ